MLKTESKPGVPAKAKTWRRREGQHRVDLYMTDEVRDAVCDMAAREGRNVRQQVSWLLKTHELLQPYFAEAAQ